MVFCSCDSFAHRYLGFGSPSGPRSSTDRLHRMQPGAYAHAPVRLDSGSLHLMTALKHVFSCFHSPLERTRLRDCRKCRAGPKCRGWLRFCNSYAVSITRIQTRLATTLHSVQNPHQPVLLESVLILLATAVSTCYHILVHAVPMCHSRSREVHTRGLLSSGG